MAMRIGAQCYTIREFTKDETGIAESMKKLSEIGYRSIQISGFGEIAPEKLREILEENGLRAEITHTNPDRILSDTQNVIREHQIIGCGCVGIGAMPERYRGGLDGMREFLREYDAAAKKLEDCGMMLSYHNHGFEFERFGGKTLFEVMAEETAPSRWCFTTDVYWAQFGGANPARVLERMKGRMLACHLKDMTMQGEEQRMAPVMEGNLDWESILPACEKAGISYAMIEQDEAYGKNPFDELRISYENLKKAGMSF